MFVSGGGVDSGLALISRKVIQKVTMIGNRIIMVKEFDVNVLLV